jgi:hypothetical protein
MTTAACAVKSAVKNDRFAHAKPLQARRKATALTRSLRAAFVHKLTNREPIIDELVSRVRDAVARRGVFVLRRHASNDVD